MSCRCVTCTYRATDEAKARPGCAYIQHTGKSRLAEVYRRLGVDHITDEVRAAMKPENCWLYQRGGKMELNERTILLAGSTPMGKGAPAPSGPPRASAPTKAAKKPKPKAEPKPPKERVRPAWEDKAREMYDAGLSDGEIGRRLGISDASVRRWRYREGRPAQIFHSERVERILELWGKGLSDGAIAKELQIDKNRVQQVRRRRGLPYHQSERQRASSAALQERRALYDRGLSDREIAEATGAKLSTVIQWREKKELPPNIGQKPKRPVSWEEEGLRLLSEGKTDTEIARAVGKSVNTVGEWRRGRGLAQEPGAGG
jgi:DNA-binding NarL/FixJ family response regulator